MAELELAERDFEVIDSHREKWAARNPRVPIEPSRIVKGVDEWTKSWRDRIPDEFKELNND